MIRDVPRSVWAARAVLVAGVLLALLADVPEGRTPPMVVLVVGLAGALLAALRPEHLVLALTLGVVMVWWAYDDRSDMPVGVLVAAAGVVAAHVAATVLSYGPPRLPVDPALALLWAARGALTRLAALAVWVVARTYTGHGTPALFWLSGLAAALVGAVAAGAVAPVRGQATRE